MNPSLVAFFMNILKQVKKMFERITQKTESYFLSIPIVE
jgi:hypothetical protein